MMPQSVDEAQHLLCLIIYAVIVRQYVVHVVFPEWFLTQEEKEEDNGN